MAGPEEGRWETAHLIRAMLLSVKMEEWEGKQWGGGAWPPREPKGYTPSYPKESAGRTTS